MNKKQLDKVVKKVFPNKYHEREWMRYENDIAKYYYPLLADWMEEERPKGKMPQGSQTAFTAGLGRFIASMCEKYWEINKRHRYKSNELIRRMKG